MRQEGLGMRAGGRDARAWNQIESPESASVAPILASWRQMGVQPRSKLRDVSNYLDVSKKVGEILTSALCIRRRGRGRETDWWWETKVETELERQEGRREMQNWREI